MIVFCSLHWFVLPRPPLLLHSLPNTFPFLPKEQASYALFTTAGLMSVGRGIGVHHSLHPNTRPLSNALRFWFISELAQIVCISLLRLSFALQLRALARTSAQRWVIFGTIAITVLYNTVFLLLMLFQCDPTQYFWIGWVPEDGKAVDRGLMELASYGFAGVGACTDWTLVLISPWYFCESELGGRTKSCLQALMALGIG